MPNFEFNPNKAHEPVQASEPIKRKKKNFKAEGGASMESRDKDKEELHELQSIMERFNADVAKYKSRYGGRENSPSESDDKLSSIRQQIMETADEFDHQMSNLLLRNVAKINERMRAENPDFAKDYPV